MQFTNLLPITGLVIGTTAANIPRRSDPHIVDFRTYGAPGCFAENQGVYTYEKSDLDICRTFVTEPVGSIFVTDITEGCFRERFAILPWAYLPLWRLLNIVLTQILSVYAYTDTACEENQITVPVGIANCYNSTAIGLGSYEITCSS